MRLLFVLPVVVACIALMACGDDDGSAGDGAPSADGTADGAATVDGAGAPDGTGASDLGMPCRSGDECASGLCTDLLGQADSTYCTAACDAAHTDCPDEGVCVVPGDLAGFCAHPCTPSGEPCPGDLTCQMWGTGWACW